MQLTMIIHIQWKISMGGQRTYNAEGGFAEQLYYSIGDAITNDGLTGKVIAEYGKEIGQSGLPRFSNTSTYYFRMNREGHIDQMRIYENRLMKLDFDWGHPHGKDFPKGVVHVQDRTTGKTRFMNNDEIQKYGNFLRKADSNVRFRP